MFKNISSVLLLIFFIILTVAIFAYPQPVFANHTIDDSVITVTQDPIPVPVDPGTVTFTITAKRDVFDVNQRYGASIWHTTNGSLKDSCPTIKNPTDTLGPTFLPKSPRELVISLSMANGCRAELGKWQLQVWLGVGVPSRTNGTLIVTNQLFDVVQAGGGVLQIVAVKTPLGLSETPQVNLINARKGNTYTFWWSDEGWFGGAWTSTALRYTAPEDGNANNLNLEKTGADFKKGGPKTLCMEIAAYLPPASLTCRYHESFDFKIIAPAPPPPATQPDCSSIQPPAPVKGDSVSITVKNLPLTPQDYRAELIKGTTTTGLLPSQNSGSLGIVTINLSPHLDEGNYTAKVYDANNQLVPGCSKDFTVGPAGATAPVATVAPCTGEGCTKAGAQVCDAGGAARGPGIITAIGCVHTNPAEFVKDFMTFIIAVSGGLSFIMMLLGAFQMLRSGGNPESLQAGRDRLTSAVIGLLFIIFAVLLLQIIGANILSLPDFKKP